MKDENLMRPGIQNFEEELNINDKIVINDSIVDSVIEKIKEAMDA